MDSILNTRSNGLSRTLVQRIHGAVLIVLGIALAIATTYSEKTGTGMYPFLQETPIAQVGLLQAYLLMSVFGTAVLLGSGSRQNDWRWNALAIVAHCVPLLTVFMYWNLFPTLNQGNTRFVSLAIHGLWISIELFAIFVLKPRQQEA